MAGSLKCASRRGLVERFDSTVGACSVLMPFGGRRQRTPAQAMSALLPVLPGQSTDTASVMAWGFDPDQLCADPYTGAKSSVYTSVAKIVAAGADCHAAYLSMQEFFEKLRTDPERWGKPFSALLGALDAQLELGAAAIGGKDSMSGSFMDLDVPPTLISFAIAPVRAGKVLSPEFKAAGRPVYLFDGKTPASVWEKFTALADAGKVSAAWAVENGLAEAVMKMSFGNEIGFRAEAEDLDWYRVMPGAIVAELNEEVNLACAKLIGRTTSENVIDPGEEKADIAELEALNDAVLEDVYPNSAPAEQPGLTDFTYHAEKAAAPAVRTARPKAVIPVFPGTNCEYDTARQLIEAGADAEIFVVRNLTAADVAQSAERFAAAPKTANIWVIPGVFSGGD